MIEIIPSAERAPRFQAVGLPQRECQSYLQAWDAHQAAHGPAAGSGTSADPGTAFLNAELQQVQAICRQGRELLGRLPLKSKRNPQEKAAGLALVHLTADACWRFLARHRVALYRELTQEGRRPLRVDELAWAAAARLSGVLPSQAELTAESQHLQMDKDGLEIHQGLFFSQVFSEPALGTHLLRSMMQPTPQALERLEEFKRAGQVDLGTVRVEARGQAGTVHFHNPRYLNAEDENTLLAWEMGVDLVLLHPELRMGVLRGDVVEHPKYKGRRIFSAGINLTRIYKGQQSYLYYLTRDLGFGNKVYRGLLPRDGAGLDVPGQEPEATLEKPWVAAVDGFAIGGGCQLLLIVDYVIAEAGSYFNLPARKEGIIPGCANLRLARFMGERMARQAIMFDKTFYVDSPEGRTLVNEVVPREGMDLALEQCVANAIGSGMVSAGGNRKAIRVQTEPLETFRAYMATYAYEQAFCHLSEQLVHNLERNWNAHQRAL